MNPQRSKTLGLNYDFFAVTPGPPKNLPNKHSKGTPSTPQQDRHPHFSQNVNPQDSNHSHFKISQNNQISQKSENPQNPQALNKTDKLPRKTPKKARKFSKKHKKPIRVKMFRLEDGDWADLGFVGYLSVVLDEDAAQQTVSAVAALRRARLGPGAKLLLRVDNSANGLPVMTHLASSSIDYQRDGETIVTWAEGSEEIAISFADAEICGLVLALLRRVEIAAEIDKGLPELADESVFGTGFERDYAKNGDFASDLNEYEIEANLIEKKKAVADSVLRGFFGDETFDGAFERVVAPRLDLSNLDQAVEALTGQFGFSGTAQICFFIL